MHGITPPDRGIVGIVDKLGHTWHGFKNYVEIDGAVSLEQAMAVVDYEVVKVPLAYHIPPELQQVAAIHGKVPMDTPAKDGTTGPLMFALVRSDTLEQVYPESIGGNYTIYPNRDFLEKVQEALLKDNPQVIIESAGTLFGGRNCFVNLVLNQFRIGKDPSDQIVRVMFYNAFGGKSITACMHFIRVVCNNTLMLAEAQGALNGTLAKYRHTKGAPEKVAKHIVDLAKLNEIAESRQQAMTWMADQPMTTIDVENFFGNLIPIPENASKGMTTGRNNRREEIETIFVNAPDLQGQIARTRYAMMQAITNYNQHHTVPESSTEVDAAFAWWDVSTGGTRHKMNQQAFELLVKPEIPAPKKKKSLADLTNAE